MGVGSILRRISHISRLGSKFSNDASVSTHLCPQTPTASITGFKSRPASVRRYSNRSGSPARRERLTMPAASRSFKRFDRRAGDILGTPRLSSLNRVGRQRAREEVLASTGCQGSLLPSLRDRIDCSRRQSLLAPIQFSHRGYALPITYASS